MPSNYLLGLLSFSLSVVKDSVTDVWIDGTDQGHEGCWVWTSSQVSIDPSSLLAFCLYDFKSLSNLADNIFVR